MKNRFVVFLFCVCQALGCFREENVHSNYFHIKPSFRLAGHVIRTTFAHSLLTCAQFCLREPRCVSLNYKDNLGGKGVCELNSKKAITSILIHDDSYNYATMEGVRSLKNVTKPEVKSLFFPVASTAKYVMLRDVITTPLGALTVCFWMRTSDTTNEGTPFSYSAKAKGGNDNEFLMIDYRNFLIRVNDGYTGYTSVNATGGKWHHICTTWDSTSGSWALYKDGQAKAQGSGVKKGYKIKHGGIIVLGQEQDSDGGRFDAQQSFIGEMTNVNIWSRALTAVDISRLSSSCAVGSGDVMKWPIAIGQQTAGVQVISSASCV